MPFGVKQLAMAFNHSMGGLHAGRKILSGNKISEEAPHSTCCHRSVEQECRSSIMCLRPGVAGHAEYGSGAVQTVGLWSNVLHRTNQLRATTHALRFQCS